MPCISDLGGLCFDSNLDDFFKEIVEDELNVKEVVLVPSVREENGGGRPQLHGSPHPTGGGGQRPQGSQPGHHQGPHGALHRRCRAA